jgi:hypothetical protein
MRRAPSFLGCIGFALSAAAGCAVDAPTETGDTARELGLAAQPAWRRTYVVATPDLRACAFPACGGYVVRAVNAATITCADGTIASECYVAVLDLGPTGLPRTTQGLLRRAIASRQSWRDVTVVLRGNLVASPYPGYGALSADAAWHGEPDEPDFPGHSSRYYHVLDVAPSTVVRRLNTADADTAVVGVPRPEVDLVVSGLRDEELLDVDRRFARVR